MAKKVVIFMTESFTEIQNIVKISLMNNIVFHTFGSLKAVELHWLNVDD